jgi:histidyl-tRNA synthetase
VTGEAPKMVDRLSDEDRQHFDSVRGLLDSARIEYELDPRLVRGLDYYTRTVFEFRCDLLGAQSGIGGGGRYDRLVEQIGGDATPAAGWATGLERITQALASTDEQDEWVEPGWEISRSGPAVLFALTEPAAREQAIRIASELRSEGIGATMDFGGRSLKGQMKQADRIGVPWVVIIGPEEWSREVAAVRDMRDHDQREVSLSALGAELMERTRRR